MSDIQLALGVKRKCSKDFICKYRPKYANVQPVYLTLGVPSTVVRLCCPPRMSSPFLSQVTSPTEVRYSRMSLISCWFLFEAAATPISSGTLTYRCSPSFWKLTVIWLCSREHILLLFIFLQLESMRFCFVRSSDPRGIQRLWKKIGLLRQNKPTTKCIVWLIWFCRSSTLLVGKMPSLPESF